MNNVMDHSKIKSGNSRFYFKRKGAGNGHLQPPGRVSHVWGHSLNSPDCLLAVSFDETCHTLHLRVDRVGFSLKAWFCAAAQKWKLRGLRSRLWAGHGFVMQIESQRIVPCGTIVEQLFLANWNTKLLLVVSDQQIQVLKVIKLACLSSSYECTM